MKEDFEDADTKSAFAVKAENKAKKNKKLVAKVMWPTHVGRKPAGTPHMPSSPVLDLPIDHYPYPTRQWHLCGHNTRYFKDRTSRIFIHTRDHVEWKLETFGLHWWTEIIQKTQCTMTKGINRFRFVPDFLTHRLCLPARACTLDSVRSPTSILTVKMNLRRQDNSERERSGAVSRIICAAY